MKAIIIDDEPKAVELLILMLEESSRGVEIVASYTDPALALSELEKLNFDVIFIDIDMPLMSGFDFLNQIRDKNYLVVFVTGYDQYAIRALELAAIGYILKPIEMHLLLNCLDQIDKRLIADNQAKSYHVLLDNLNSNASVGSKIGIPTLSSIEFISIGNIVACEGFDRYTKVIVESGKDIVTSYSIGEFVKYLEAYQFYLVHRSALVNLTKIQSYKKDGTVIMENGFHATVARRRREDFLSRVTTIRRS